MCLQYTPSKATANRLEKATKLMNEIYNAPTDEHLARCNMRNIETQLSLAGVALGTFLADFYHEKFAPALVVAEVSAEIVAEQKYICQGCGRTFDNPKAFQGHGQSRCLKRHNK